MLEKQKAVEGECLITTVLFDNHYDLLHDRIDIQSGQFNHRERVSNWRINSASRCNRKDNRKIGNAQNILLKTIVQKK